MGCSCSKGEGKTITAHGNGAIGKTTEMYDDKDKEWKAAKSMKSAQSGLQVVTLDHYTLNYKDFV